MAILFILLLLLSLFALRLSSLLSFTVTTIIMITFTIRIIIAFIMKINIPFYDSRCKLVSVILHRSREYSRFLRDFAHDDGC